MARAFLIILACLLVLSTGMAMASPVCPWNPDIPAETIPAASNVQALTVGSVFGTAYVHQSNVWQTSGNETGLQSNYLSAFSGPGTLNIAAETTLLTQQYGLTSSTTRAIEYDGQGMALDDSNLFEMTSNGIESFPACEHVLGGASAMFSSGAYGSQTLGIISPVNGLTVQQQIGTGEAVPVTPAGMQGSITVFGSSGQMYGDMGQEFETSATFTGISTVAHQFEFNTISEE